MDKTREQIIRDVESEVKKASTRISELVSQLTDAMNLSEANLSGVISKYKYLAGSLPLDLVKVIEDGGIIKVASFKNLDAGGMNRLLLHAEGNVYFNPQYLELGKGEWNIILVAIPKKKEVS